MPIVTLLIAFFSLIALVVIHEFGHFVLAKKFGAKVDEFGIGYPPRIFGKKFGETIYSLNILPFGAFVKIHGEEGGVEDYHSFSGKPMWQRALIVVGGVASFWIVAVVLLTLVAGFWGVPQAVSDDENDRLINPMIQVTDVVENSPAGKAGFKIGDFLVDFDKISSLQEFVSSNKGQEITLNVKRGQTVFSTELMPRFFYPEDEGPIGLVLVRVAFKPYTWWEAPLQGLIGTYRLTVDIVSGWVLGLKNLFGLAELPEGVKLELVGPLGIFSMLSQYSQIGLNYFLYLIALIAVALALANLLPIPALDGGKLMFLFLEWVRKKPLNEKLEQKITAVFFVLLILMMIFVTIKFDIPKVF
ncbi:MAG: M50 family metallopeptidase [Candidatus Nealsonbacteria bacterium]